MLTGFKSSKAAGRKRASAYVRQAPLGGLAPARSQDRVPNYDPNQLKRIFGKGRAKQSERARTQLSELVRHEVDEALEDALQSLARTLAAIGNPNTSACLPGGARDPGFQALLQARTEELLKTTPVLQGHFEANAELRARFVERTALWTAAEVADFSGSKATNRHALASRWAAEKHIFSVLSQKSLLYPAFQFDLETQRPYKEVRAIIKALDRDYEGWSLAIWFVTPNEWLDSAEPLSVWPSARAQVVAAAEEEHELFHG